MHTEHSIPVGTVTFLFSDIESSTRQWEHHPDVMSQALAKHDEIMRTQIEAQRGYVFKTVGDAFCAAFHTAKEAITAAVDCQRALDSETWPAPIRIKVRMGIHTGVAESRVGDYFGQPLNRVARLQSTGAGGQVLVSLATQLMVRDNLPSDISLQHLGEWRLKDLVQSEQIFQVVAPGLDLEFPPLKTLDRIKNNLPVQLTSFVGREAEMSEIAKLLETARLVTLTGSGGAGKTRLSIQISAEVIDHYADGVWQVELGALTETQQVVKAIAEAVAVAEEPSVPVLDSLISALRSKRVLLILDNCEHLLDSSAHAAEALLRACPDLQMLTTSREPLGIAGEQTYRVPSLTLPPIAGFPTPEELGQYAAVRLFVDRATLTTPSFAITDQNAPALAQLCTRLDGIPLALELAAARCRALSVQEIHSRLDDRFKLLTGGSRTALPRQKTLRALVDWSYDLLDEEEQRLLTRLSVFANGWTLEAAEALDEEDDVLDLLSSLVDKSLVIADPGDSGTRYRLLQTVRDYALDRLLESGEAAELRGRHRDYFLALSEEASRHLYGADQTQWLSRLDTEHDNLRAALNWCLMERDVEEKGLRLSHNLYMFWWIRGHLSEGNRWSQELAEVTADRPLSVNRGEALLSAGNFVLYQGEYDLARKLISEGLEVRKANGDLSAVASGIHSLAHVYHLEGDLASAKPIYEDSLARRRELDDLKGMAATLNNLANLAQDLKEFEEARAMHEEALAIRRKLGGAQGISQTLHNLGCLAIAQGDYTGALLYCRESLDLVIQLQDPRSIYQTFHSFAEIASQGGRANDAANLWGVAAAMRESIGIPVYEVDRERQEKEYQHAKDAIGEAAFMEAWQAGRKLTLEEARDIAMRQ